MDQKFINLYDKFTHGGMSRREFLDRLAETAGSAAAAAALLPLLQNDYAKAATIAPDDSRLASEKITYDTPTGKASGYLSRPRAKGKRPAIVVIHANRGIDPHIQDVTRRLGAEGFLALVPDLLSPFGGTPADDDEARKLFSAKIDRNDVSIPVATVSFLKTHPESTGKVGMIGFCFGGGIVNRTAAAGADLAAAVVYYGDVPAADKVPGIRPPLLLHYAGLDARVNAGIPAYEAALKANNKTYTKYMYEGANHAFNDDTAGSRYDKAAADLAWGRSLAFFKEYLGAPPNAA